MSDFRAGQRALINNADAYDEFYADLYAFEPIAAQISSEWLRNIGKSTFIVNKYLYEASGARATFYVYGATKDECEMNVSRFLAYCKQCEIRFPDDDSFVYDCLMTGFSHSFYGIDFYQEVVITFAVVKRKDLQTKTVTSTSMTIENEGTLTSGLKLILSSTSSRQNVTVSDNLGNQIKIKSMAANTNYIIDGIEGKVLKGVLNDYGNIEVINFPKVEMGHNEIVASASIKIEASYYPTFVF